MSEKHYIHHLKINIWEKQKFGFLGILKIEVKKNKFKYKLIDKLDQVCKISEIILTMC